MQRWYEWSMVQMVQTIQLWSVVQIIHDMNITDSSNCMLSYIYYITFSVSSLLDNFTR